MDLKSRSKKEEFILFHQKLEIKRIIILFISLGILFLFIHVIGWSNLSNRLGYHYVFVLLNKRFALFPNLKLKFSDLN